MRASPYDARKLTSNRVLDSSVGAFCHRRRLFSKQRQMVSILGYLAIGFATSLSVFSLFTGAASSRLRTLSVQEKGSHEQEPIPQLLPRQRQQGTWIGDVWIPPSEWKLYSTIEQQELWDDDSKGILWIGDSTARRTSLTMWEILNATTDGEGALDIPKALLEENEHINVNHKGHALEKCTKWPRIRGADICRTLPSGHPFVFKRLNCYHEVMNFLEYEVGQADSVLHHVDTIVLSLGLWDITLESQCVDDSFPKDSSALDRQRSLLKAIQNLPKNLTILWRTTSYANSEDAKAIDSINNDAMDEMDRWWKGKLLASSRPNAFYINFSGAIFSRSFANERIQGDHYAHYGSTARVVMVQMLSNTLKMLKVSMNSIEKERSR